MKNCRVCVFWDSQDSSGGELGWCKRAAPQPTGWPVTQAWEWCGQYTSALGHRFAGLTKLLQLLLAILVLLTIIALTVSRLTG